MSAPRPAARAPAMPPDRASGQGDRCPGALRLHTANDGALARVRLPGGRLTPNQLDEIASAATDLGDGDLHITSRGNIQIRGLDSGCGQDLADRLWAAGLLPSIAHDRVRNIVASPLTGLDGRGLLDIEHVLVQVDSQLLGDVRLVELSGRFLIGIDDGRGDALALRPDLALVAEGGGRLRLWVDGRPTTSTRHQTTAAAALLGAARRFLDLRDRLAPGAWRVRELGEAAAEIAQPAASAPALLPPAPAPTHGIHEKGRHSAICAGIPFGSSHADHWHHVAEIARSSENGLAAPIRVTPWRGVVVGGLSPDKASEALISLQHRGFATANDHSLVHATACTGRPGCASALTDVRADARVWAEAGHPPYPVHFSGCERRCGHPGGARAEAVAVSESHYRIDRYADDGSRVNGSPHVPACDLAGALTTTAITRD